MGKPSTEVRTTKDGCFEWGYVDDPSQWIGPTQMFWPHWWAQYLGDGTMMTFTTKKECLAWIKEWDEIAE